MVVPDISVAVDICGTVQVSLPGPQQSVCSIEVTQEAPYTVAACLATPRRGRVLAGFTTISGCSLE